MSSSTDPTAPSDDSAKEALAAELIGVRNRLTTPHEVGLALRNLVLTDAVRRGKQVDNDTFELPMTATTKIERPAAAPGSTMTGPTVCVHTTITVFGIEVASWTTCETATLELA